MKEGVEFAHRYNVKVYVTANILAHNSDIEPVKAYFNDLKKVKPDALIIADPAIFTIAKEMLPDMELHISTQAYIGPVLILPLLHISICKESCVSKRTFN